VVTPIAWIASAATCLVSRHADSPNVIGSKSSCASRFNVVWVCQQTGLMGSIDVPQSVRVTTDVMQRQVCFRGAVAQRSGATPGEPSRICISARRAAGASPLDVVSSCSTVRARINLDNIKIFRPRRARQTQRPRIGAFAALRGIRKDDRLVDMHDLAGCTVKDDTDPRLGTDRHRGLGSFKRAHRSPPKEKRYGPARPGLIADERESRSQEPRNKQARHQRVDIDVVEIGGVAGLALHRAAGSARMRAPLSIRKLPRQ
jgi:hypothetical protein